MLSNANQWNELTIGHQALSMCSGVLDTENNVNNNIWYSPSGYLSNYHITCFTYVIHVYSVHIYYMCITTCVIQVYILHMYYICRTTCVIHLKHHTCIAGTIGHVVWIQEKINFLADINSQMFFVKPQNPTTFPQKFKWFLICHLSPLYLNMLFSPNSSQ